jgi:putative transposase
MIAPIAVTRTQKGASQMTQTNSIEVRRVLSSVISPSQLEQTAREAGFIRRARKVEPVAFFWTLVLGFGAGAEKSLASLRRCYALYTGTPLVPSAFYDRFTPALAQWLQRILLEVLQKTAGPARALGGRLSSFIDLMAIDGTVVRLHDLLERAYPACRTNHTKAAAKLTVVMSVTGKGAHSVQLSSERRNDSKLLHVGPWVMGRLLLFDLGYYGYRLFQNIARCGGYFVTRLKVNANPTIVTVLNGSKADAALEGLPLQTVLARLRRPVLDAIARVRYKNKRGRWVHAEFRLIALRNQDTKKYHLYITNVPQDRLSAEDIGQTYAVRWEIEILFRQLKSQFRLDKLPSADKDIVHALLYATLLTLAVSRAFLNAMRKRCPAMAGRMPAERWAVLFATLAQTLLALILVSRRRGKRRESDIGTVMLQEVIDPNRTRAGGLLARLEGTPA